MTDQKPPKKYRLSLAEQRSARTVQSDNVHAGMKLIPWEDIWKSLLIAKMRGNKEMIDVFLNSLYQDAIFDDRGAWSSLVSLGPRNDLPKPKTPSVV